MAKKRTLTAKKPLKAKKRTLTAKPLTAKKLVTEGAKIALERHCTDIVALDLKGKSPATDYFLIATGTSDRQIKSVADEITEFAHKHNLRVFGRAGYEQGKWVLLDFVDVVVHLFNEESREYYDLELLWGDAKRLKI